MENFPVSVYFPEKCASVVDDRQIDDQANKK